MLIPIRRGKWDREKAAHTVTALFRICTVLRPGSSLTAFVLRCHGDLQVVPAKSLLCVKLRLQKIEGGTPARPASVQGASAGTRCVFLFFLFVFFPLSFSAAIAPPMSGKGLNRSTPRLLSGNTEVENT